MSVNSWKPKYNKEQPWLVAALKKKKKKDLNPACDKINTMVPKVANKKRYVTSKLVKNRTMENESSISSGGTNFTRSLLSLRKKKFGANMSMETTIYL